MTIEAKIRISAITDQAVKAMRDLKSAKDALATPTTSGGGKAPFSDVSAGAIDAAAKTKTARREVEAMVVATTAGITAAKAEAEAVKVAQRAQQAAAEEASRAIREARNQSRLLAPQLTDIVVGLSTGQSPFTVLLQQGGQLKDVMGGVGNAFKAVTSIFTVARVVIGGVAAAFAAVAFAAVEGSRESAALNKTLALTGNIAGTSAGQLALQAQQLAASQKASIGDVRETLTALVATGNFTSTSLGSAGRAAVALSKLTGTSAADTIKQFDGMSQGVAAWAAKSNIAYNFLTGAQFKYIQSLEAQGRTQEAMRVTLDALSDAVEKRTAPAVGTLEKAWNKLKETLGGVVDRLKEIGRDETPESKLQKLLEKMAEVDAMRAKLAGKQDRTSQLQLANSDPEKARLQAEVDAAAEVLKLAKRSAGEKAAIAEKNQKDIEQASKGFQDSLSAISAAGSQKRLAEELAALDLRQARVEKLNAQGLLGAIDYSKQLNQIELQRLAAQEANLKRLIGIEGGKTVTNPAETNARAAAVVGLEAQLADVKGRIAAAAVKGQSDIAAIALTQARDKANEWAAIWKQAYDQVRTLAAQNGATQAALVADPIGRATAEATLKTADLRRQIQELQRDLDLRLSLTVDPGQRALLQREIAELASQSKAALEEATRGASFTSLQTQFAEFSQALVLQEQRLAIAVDQSTLSVEEAERRKFAARAASLPQLETILRAMQELATTAAERNAIEALVQDVVKLKDATTEFQKSLKASAVTGLASVLSGIASGAKTGKAALLDMVGSFAKAILDVLSKRLATKLVDGAIEAYDKFAKSTSGGSSGGSGGVNYGSIISAFFKLFHTGGVVGQGGGQSRAASPSMFIGAPRYHTEGIAGLRPREVPAILEEGEEVLSAGNPRHIKNFKGSGGGDMVFPITVNGVPGDDGQKQAFGEELTRRIRVVALDLLGEQSRQGGLLAKGR